GFGCAGRVTDIQSSTFVFVLRRSTTFLPPTMDARRCVAAASAGSSPLAGELGGLKMRIVPALFSSVIVCGLLAIRMATAADGPPGCCAADQSNQLTPSHVEHPALSQAPPRKNCASLRSNSNGFDHARPFFDLTLDEFLEVLGGPAVRGDKRIA